MAEHQDKVASGARIAVLVALGVLSAAFLAPGGFFYGWVVADYLEGDSPFTGLQMLGWMLGLIAAGMVSVGLLLAGVLLRLMPSPQAPLASLGVAIVAVAFVILTYLVFSDTGNGSSSIEVVLLQGACILYLFLIALPPFLHWALAKPPAVRSTAETER